MTSPNSALPSHSRRLCGDCEIWTAVGWGGGGKMVLGVQVAAIQEINKSDLALKNNLIPVCSNINAVWIAYFVYRL